MNKKIEPHNHIVPFKERKRRRVFHEEKFGGLLYESE